MSLMWHSESECTDSSIGHTVSSRLFTQSRKLRAWSGLFVSWTLNESSLRSIRLSGWRLTPVRSTCTQPSVPSNAVPWSVMRR